VRRLDAILAGTAVFAGLTGEQLETIVGCAQNVGFARGEHLFRAGGAADTFYVVRRGRVALTLDAAARGALTVETVEPGEVVGWSWLHEPYRWHFDAVAVEDVRAIAIDGACLRGKCAADPALGYALMRGFGPVMIERLEHTQMRLVDVYGHHRD
jgi:CRP/FNR family transcriptional regulator, cyclic AMP receptor protein